MTTTEIADELNRAGLYSKKDGSIISPFQIHGRTKNYEHLFNREGSTVSLKSKTGIGRVLPTPKPKTSISSVSSNPSLAAKVLMNEKNFKSAAEIDDHVPDQPGLYAIRIVNPSVLNAPFDQILVERNHNIIYTGIASQSLKKRFLGQELRAGGHGTFFRSMGAVLGFRPEPGSLVGKKNKNNYTFSSKDEQSIISWINKNLLVNWVTMESDLDAIEYDLIKEHLPLLNIAGNPGALDELKALREECKLIATSKEGH